MTAKCEITVTCNRLNLLEFIGACMGRVNDKNLEWHINKPKNVLSGRLAIELPVRLLSVLLWTIDRAGCYLHWYDTAMLLGGI